MQESVPLKSCGDGSQMLVKSVIASVLIFIFFVSILISLGVSRKNNKCFDKVSYYFVYAQKSKIKTDEKQKDLVKSLGGAGVFYFYKEYYYLLVSVYLIKEDASEIADGIKSQFKNAGVLTIETKRLQFKVQQKIKDNFACFKFFKQVNELVKSFEGVAVDFCKGTLSPGDLMTGFLKNKLEIESLSVEMGKNVSGGLVEVVKKTAKAESETA